MFQSGVCACFRKTALFGSVWICCFLYQVQLYWIRFSSFLRSQGRIGPKCWTSLPWKHQMRKYLLVIMIHNKPEFPFCFLWGQGMLATKLICTQCCPKENCLYGFSKQTNTFISIQTTQKRQQYSSSEHTDLRNVLSCVIPIHIFHLSSLFFVLAPKTVFSSSIVFLIIETDLFRFERRKKMKTLQRFRGLEPSNFKLKYW